MKNNWTCKDLRRSKVDIRLNTILLLFIVLSYLPQICLILSRRSTSGITQTYVLFNYLFTATQFAMVLLYSSYHHPIVGCIADQKLRGLDAYGAVLGLVQITVLWLGSISLLTLFLFFPNEKSTGRGLNTAHSNTNTTPSADRHRHPRTMLFLCIVHLCVWVLPIIGISMPRPRGEMTVWPNTLFIGFCDYILITACIALVISEFPLQIKAILSSRHTTDESSLSLATLAMQMIAFVLLGLSWKIRLGRPGDPFNVTPPDITDPWALYRLGAWQYVNNIIFGIGQGVLLVVSLWVMSQKWTLKERGQRAADERTSLLRAA